MHHVEDCIIASAKLPTAKQSYSKTTADCSTRISRGWVGDWQLTFFYAVLLSLATILFLLLHTLGALVIVVLEGRALGGLEAVCRCTR